MIEYLFLGLEYSRDKIYIGTETPRLTADCYRTRKCCCNERFSSWKSARKHAVYNSFTIIWSKCENNLALQFLKTHPCIIVLFYSVWVNWVEEFAKWKVSTTICQDLFETFTQKMWLSKQETFSSVRNSKQTKLRHWSGLYSYSKTLSLCPCPLPIKSGRYFCCTLYECDIY